MKLGLKGFEILVGLGACGGRLLSQSEWQTDSARRQTFRLGSVGAYFRPAESCERSLVVSRSGSC